MTSSTAILLFTRTASQEAEKKQFVSEGKKKNTKISQRLISASLRKIKRSQLPYFVISSDQQQGKSFGERFTNAIEAVFLKGYDKVIAIGNDSPQLTPQLLIHAANELSYKKLVLGPDKRGGIYLLGISRNAFNRNHLLNFHWNSPHLYQDFIKWRNDNNFSCTILPRLRDVNDAADLKWLIQRKNISIEFLHTILSITVSSSIATIREILFYKNYSEQTSIDRRGPPTFALLF